ncbi:DUF6691 family protein [Larsenimonas rhizosphaerae]|uniref:YeeE/YedE family protein n=1 Tax=Larsenimonas rhizosphaerae TaxID=2944682 RepID=A0AA41ZHF7_9GAMM|nr:DUF6691 family protein [Larsenimonas rhizosphaerae]MCM2131948.1 YeeE/YedE family protein [Larsenimonas rhizosphaerae]MCX2524746.1 YeeE/YedE family protein [Larsenimonas rhizosphaerae]
MFNKLIMKPLAGLIAGLLFSMGLALSGMTDPRRVLAFLDVAGRWDPTLLVVFGSAVLTTFIGYRLVWRQDGPLLTSRFQLPALTGIDRRLIGGAALFGVGCGMVGYVPGSAMASMGGGYMSVWLMLAFMVLGWCLTRRKPSRP